jgi:hypothetical protein
MTDDDVEKKITGKPFTNIAHIYYPYIIFSVITKTIEPKYFLDKKVIIEFDLVLGRETVFNQCSFNESSIKNIITSFPDPNSKKYLKDYKEVVLEIEPDICKQLKDRGIMTWCKYIVTVDGKFFEVSVVNGIDIPKGEGIFIKDKIMYKFKNSEVEKKWKADEEREKEKKEIELENERKEIEKEESEGIIFHSFDRTYPI